MLKFLSVRLTTSLVALLGVMVIVFFLARLTGSPAALYLPVTLLGVLYWWRESFSWRDVRRAEELAS